METPEQVNKKAPEWRHWTSSSGFIVNFEIISYFVLVFLLVFWANNAGCERSFTSILITSILSSVNKFFTVSFSFSWDNIKHFVVSTWIFSRGFQKISSKSVLPETWLVSTKENQLDYRNLWFLANILNNDTLMYNVEKWPNML